MSLSSQDPIDVDMTILVSPLVLRVLQDSAQSESAASIPFLQDAAYAVLRILYAVQVWFNLIILKWVQLIKMISISTLGNQGEQGGIYKIGPGSL